MYTLSDKLRFIQKCFGRYELGRAGLNVAVKCPNCGYGEKRKFVIRTNDDACHCWVCGIKARTLASIIKRFCARELLDEYRSVFAKDFFLSLEDEKIKEIVSVPDGFHMLTHMFDSRDPDVQATIRYVRSRYLTEDDLWYYKLGYCDKGSFRRRVVVPSFDDVGKLNFFVARSIDDRTRPKYLNAPVDKKSIVFNELNIDFKKELTLVEGPFDLVKCDTNAVCVLGSELSEDSLLLSRIIQNMTPVVLALDSDMQFKMQKIAKRLAKFGVDVRIIDHGSRHDVGEMSKEEFLNVKNAALCWNRDVGLLYKISKISSSSSV